MTLFSAEHYEMIEMFERIFKKHWRLDKEEQSWWPKGVIYQNGEANAAFLAFREGVAYGKAISQ